jgi:hypothetical protein
MNFKRKAARAALSAATATALLGVAGTAQAAFQGRDATGAASGGCTALGPGKCTYFYDTTLNITILNNWNLGTGSWSAIAAPGSTQALAASAGLTTSGLSGWVLPTGDGGAAAGAQNQYLSIWNSVGGSFAGLSGQFDGVQVGDYWSATVFAPNPSGAWFVHAAFGGQSVGNQNSPLFAVAVRPGDVAAMVPEPEGYAMGLVGFGTLLAAARWRKR